MVESQAWACQCACDLIVRGDAGSLRTRHRMRKAIALCLAGGRVVSLAIAGGNDERLRKDARDNVTAWKTDFLGRI